MTPPIDGLNSDGRERMLADIYYLNMEELREFCDARGISYIITIENADGRITQSRDADRKGIVIDRIVHFLKTGTIKPATIFRKEVVASKPLDRAPVELDRIFYRQYKNHDDATLALMKHLTDGKFEFGAMAQETIRACWTRGEAPTYREFARHWERAVKEHDKPNPEWAFLTDRAKGTADKDWKKLRSQKATAVLKLLKKIAG